MTGLIYVVRRDYGFAPNPFGGICTLATCKPNIREYANLGDWILGVGSILQKQKNKLVYLMQVTKKITFDEYWSNLKYLDRRPILNGSLRLMYGDNIYHFDTDADHWIQSDSHHSLEGGKTNVKNLLKDTRSKYVLISNNYYYFGKNAIEIPEDFRSQIYWSGQNYKRVRDLDCLARFLEWVAKNYERGYHADPLLFKDFKRYDGKS